MFVNGGPTKEFVPQKGHKQGDPIAPFLFTYYYGRGIKQYDEGGD